MIEPKKYKAVIQAMNDRNITGIILGTPSTHITERHIVAVAVLDIAKRHQTAWMDYNTLANTLTAWAKERRSPLGPFALPPTKENGLDGAGQYIQHALKAGDIKLGTYTGASDEKLLTEYLIGEPLQQVAGLNYNCAPPTEPYRVAVRFSDELLDTAARKLFL